MAAVKKNPGPPNGKPEKFFLTVEWVEKWIADHPATTEVEDRTAAARAAAAARPKGGGQAVDPSDPAHHESRIERATLYVKNVPGAVSGGGGHNHTFGLACRLSEKFALDHGELLEVMTGWNAKCDPPWSAAELEHKVTDALAKTEGKERGKGLLPYLRPGKDPNPEDLPTLILDDDDIPFVGAEEVKKCREKLAAHPIEEFDDADQSVRVEFANYTNAGEPGDKKPTKVARVMSEIDEARKEVVGDWPRRVGDDLFTDDGDYESEDITSPAALFAWLGKKSWVRWTKGADYVPKEEYFAHLKKHVQAYESVERFPHWPPRPNTYYIHPPVEGPGDGKALARLVSFFKGSTPLDDQLILSFVLTLFWGGEPGSRPMFIFTSEDGDHQQGRGVGKTSVVKLLANGLVCRGGMPMLGFTTVYPNDDMAVITTRLLSPSAAFRRVALIDNLKTHRFSWADLEGQITSPAIDGRKLYVGNGSRPNLLTWAVTLNGASVSKDIGQRTIMIILRRPDYDADWADTVAAFIRDNYSAILADIRALLMAEPPVKLTPTRWASWERGVLSHVADPEACQELILRRQADIDADKEESNEFRDFIKKKLDEKSYRPETKGHPVVLISSQTMADWYAEAYGKREAPCRVTTIVKGFGIENLESTRSEAARGWLWRWNPWDKDAKPYPGTVL
jgi:hypothetical protein